MKYSLSCRLLQLLTFYIHSQEQFSTVFSEAHWCLLWISDTEFMGLILIGQSSCLITEFLYDFQPQDTVRVTSRGKSDRESTRCSTSQVPDQVPKMNNLQQKHSSFKCCTYQFCVYQLLGQISILIITIIKFFEKTESKDVGLYVIAYEDGRMCNQHYKDFKELNIPYLIEIQ